MSNPHDPNDYQPAWEPEDPSDYRRVEVSPARRKKTGPPKRPGDQNKKLLKYAIWAVVGLVLYFFISSALKKKSNWTYGYPPVTLSSEQQAALKKLGEEIAEFLTNGAGEDAHKYTNWTVATNRIESGVDKDVVARNAVRKTINEKVASDSPGLFRPIMRDRKFVDSAFLGMNQREGYPAATLRCTVTPDRVEYYDILIYPIKEESNQLRVIDIYDYQLGIYQSDRARWLGIQEAGMEKESTPQWETAFGPGAAAHRIDLKKLISDDYLNRGGNAYSTIKTFPEPFRSNPMIWALEVQALRNAIDEKKSTDDDRQHLLEILAKGPTNPRNKPMTSQLISELYWKAGVAQEAENQLLKTHEAMKDGYLRYHLSKWKLDKGDVAGAEAAYKQAKAEVPTLKLLFNHGKAIEAKKATP